MSVPSATPFSIGDTVKLRQIPKDLHDAAGIGTPRVFEQALGASFPVMGFNEHGLVELCVTKADTIWIEPEFLELVRKSDARRSTIESSG